MSTHVVLVLGQKGVGKSSLINGIKESYVPDYDETKSRTKVLFEVKELIKGNDHYQFIDTPGLLAASKGYDDKYRDEIKKAASEFPQLKCILLLFNLQNRMFDASTIQMVQNYINMFPVRYFWQHVIIVYTRAKRYDDDCVEEIESRRGIFEKSIREKKEFEELRQFMNDKNIAYPNKLPEFFVDSKKNLKNIDNDTKKEYENLLITIKGFPNMFKEIKKVDRDVLVGETSSSIPHVKTYRKIIFKPNYGNIIELNEFLLKESDKTNLYLYEKEVYKEEFYKKERCRNVKFYKVYETKIYIDKNGKEFRGNRNYVGEREA